MLQLTLIRHAATALNERRIFQGVRFDPDLAPAGLQQARRLGRRLAARGFRPDALWCSDLLRARRTAELAFPGTSPRLDARLREIDLGGFEGLSYEENTAFHDTIFDRWLADPHAIRPPNDGELLSEVRARVDEWLAALPRSGRLAVVTHGGTICAALESLVGMPFIDGLRLDLRPTEAVRLWIDAGGSVALAFLPPR